MCFLLSSGNVSLQGQLKAGMLNCVVISLKGKTMTPMICKVAWAAPLYV